MTRDYLVIYEGDDGEGDDAFTVDLARARRTKLGALEVQHALDLGLRNTSSRLGTSGFITTIVGAVVSLVTMVLFAVNYPSGWYGDGAGVRAVIITGFTGLVLLIAGTMMTHYGRRIQAQGALRGIRIIEKAPRSGFQ